MSLTKGRHDDIPKDAVRLGELDAIKYQIKIMNSWKNKRDTFAFLHGGAILGGASALVGIYLNSHYRLRFKLLMHGRVSSYVPICFLPAVISVLLHTRFVLTDVAIQKSCAVCRELRSSTIQVMSGFVLPGLLAPASSLALALQYNTYNIPYITKEPMKVFQLWRKQTKPIANTLLAICVCQMLLGSIVTYFESKAVLKVNAKLAELERTIEHGVDM